MTPELNLRTPQSPVTDLPHQVWDVIVAGAGPAGCTTAIRLARCGQRVLLLDKEAFPREKICGDGLIADAVRCLERLGLKDQVLVAGHQVQSAALFSPSRVKVDVPGEFLTLKRAELDLLLARAAVEAGAVFGRGTLRGVTYHKNGEVTFAADGIPLRARTGVLATGAGIKLPRTLGLVTEPQPSAVAVRQYVRSTTGPEQMVVSYDLSIIPGYAWIFPLGNGEFNVGCGTFRHHASRRQVNLRALLDRFLKQFPIARQLMAGGEAISPPKGAPLRCGLTGTAPNGDGNLLLVGEAIGVTYPLTGEGIGKSMETGELAADVIHDALRTGDFERLRQFEPRLEAELRPSFRGYHTAERWLSKAWLADFFARRLQRSHYLREIIAGVFSNSVDPRAAFSLGGLLRSFFV